MRKQVSLWDLPEGKIYIELDPIVKRKLFDSAYNYAGTWPNLGRVLGLHINKYGNCKLLESSVKKKVSLRVLKLILRYLKENGEKINYNFIEQSVLSLSPPNGCGPCKSNRLLNPKLPFDFDTVSGAIVISALLHDGGINSNHHPHYSGPMDLSARCRVARVFKEVFGDFNFKRSDPVTCGQLYFPKVIGYILVYGLGLGKGRKVTNNPGIPEFIFKSSKSVRSAFLRQAFDDEGHVHKTSRYVCLKLASASNSPANLLLDIQKLSLSLDVKSRGPYFSESYVSKMV